jgi:hypothetical protein
MARKGRRGGFKILLKKAFTNAHSWRFETSQLSKMIKNVATVDAYGYVILLRVGSVV